jgi:hypothetical protein
MKKRLLLALVVGAVALRAQAHIEPPPLPAAAQVDGAEEAPTRIIVEGRRPGPGVWKVSKGDHVMWIFGVYSPLPKKMEWDDSRVERLVKGSQELLMPPVFSAGLAGFGGFLRGLTALPSLIGIENNPDDATLHDVLPADVYARWTVAKQKYIGNGENLERLRPILAAERLKEAAYDQNGLSGNSEIIGRIVEIAQKNKVKKTFTGVSFVVKDPRGLLKDIKGSQMEDLPCFTRTLDNIESELSAMHMGANAWANGNIAEIKDLDLSDRDLACKDAVAASPAMRKAAGIDNLIERLRQSWMVAAEKALGDNPSTFAVLQLQNILGPDGALAALQARGYTVESPK